MITTISSPFETPAAPGALCVIVDASFDTEVPAQVERHMSYGVERCVPLFDTTPYAGLQAAGPFALLCPAPGALTDYASSLLERADAGCVAYLHTVQSFDCAVEHWRSLLTVHTDDTPSRLMRFFEPRWLEPLLYSLDDAERLRFMGPMTHLAWRNELGWRHLANPRPDSPVDVQAPGWFHLGSERQAAMEQHRLKVLAQRFALDYQAVLKRPKPVDFVYRQLQAARHAGFLQLAEQERWLRMALRQGDSFWSHSPARDVLARDDLSLRDKLIRLERF